MKVFSRKNREPSASSRLQSSLPRYKGLVLVIIIGIVLSLALFAISRKAEKLRLSLNFSRDAEKRIAVLKRELAINLHEIDDLRTYYDASELVTRSEFSTYTFHTTSRYPGITAEMWVPRVFKAERGPFESGTREELNLDFQITEKDELNRLVRAETRGEHYPIHFIEPYGKYEIFLGFDLFSDPEIAEILTRSRDTGNLVVAKQVALGKPDNDLPGYLIIYPHYRKGLPLDTAENLRKAHAGFLIGVLDLAQIVINAMSYLEEEPIDVFLFDRPLSEGSPPLYHYLKEEAGSSVPTPLTFERARREGMLHEETINLANMNLQIVLTPTVEYITTRKTSIPFGILLAGLTATFFLALYIFIILRHNTRIHQFATNLLQIRYELTRERNRAQRYLDIAGVIIVALNRNGEITLINRKGSEILGYGEGELVGENWFQKCLPEKTDEEVSHIFQKVMGGEMALPVDIEYPILTKSGEKRVISWVNSFVTDEEGNIIGKLSSGEDITDRKRSTEALKESEKRFRDLVESSLTGILIVQDKQIVYRNPEQERLFGDIRTPMKLTDFRGIHEDDRERFFAMFERIGSGTQDSVEDEFRYYHPGTPGKKSYLRWIYCRASAIQFQGKGATLVNVMDITRSKELEMVIKDKMTSLGRVAAGIAHEIRNPLSGINVYISTLKKTVEGCEKHETAREIISQIQSASNKIESVVRRAMDFSKPGEIRFSVTNVNTLVEEAINLSSVSLRKSGIEIDKELDRDLPSCYADKRLFEQVIVNLISNAAEAMRDLSGSRIIRVTTSSENNTILLRISDSGPGVSEELREKVFDPFFTTKSENTGLGLSISNRIITDHGGQMDITRSEWGGAEFVLTIPQERRKKRR